MEIKMAEGEGRALFETPTWAVATVFSVMVLLSLLIEHSLDKLGEWLDKTKRKALMASLEKIKDELMLFGLLSLLMGHWIDFMSKICVNSSAVTSKFRPCVAPEVKLSLPQHFSSALSFSNDSVRLLQEQVSCPKGKEPFASKETLEQLHRLIFVLGVTHICYSFAAVTLALVKIYSWRPWENQAKEKGSEDSEASSRNARMRRLTTFISQQTSHPWSQHRVFVWLLCFGRQFWRPLSQADYMALRLGFITSHQLPLTYDFLNYILRSMEEEFCNILGISALLWMYAILCILLDFHGTKLYFYLSFLPSFIILLMGTKLHRVVVKLAVEIMDRCPVKDFHQFRLRDELFWFRRPKLLSHLIQLVTFQNAFEMASFFWSLWEIKDASCFMHNRRFLVIRLAFGIITQFCCSFITFPLYVVVTQMGSRFRKTIVTERVRESLLEWRKRVRYRYDGESPGGADPSVILTSCASVDRLSTMERLSMRRNSMRGQSETPPQRENQPRYDF